jgi:hypothetical protein
MSNNETSLGLHLGVKNGFVVLVLDYKITKFENLKIESTPTVVFNPAISSNITIKFNEIEATDTADRPENLFSSIIPIELGPYRSSVTRDPSRTIGEWESNCQPSDNAHRKYIVTVEVNGQDGRKTVTYISEDADIDLTKKHEDLELPESNQV